MKHRRAFLERLVPGMGRIRFGTIARARRTFADALRGERRRILITLAATGAATVLQLAIPWPLQVILDRVLAPVASGEVSASHAYILTAAALAAALIPLGAAHLAYRARIAAAEVGKVATVRIRRRLFDHLNRLSVDFHDQNRTGDLLVRLTGDVNLLRDMLFTSWVNLLDRSLYFTGLALALLLVDWRLGLLALLPLPFLSRKVRDNTAELRTVVRSQRKREGSAAAFAGESLSQIRVIKAFGAEGTARDRFAAVAGRSEKAGVKAARLAAGLELSTQTVSAIGAALVLWGGAILVILGDLTPGVLLVAAAYAKSLYKPLRKMSGEATRLAKATAVADRILDILEQAPEPEGLGLAIPEGLRGEVEARAVAFRYPDGPIAIQRAEFHVPAGSLVHVDGPNGAGKSTLLSLLLRFAQPTTGDLRVDGRPIDHWRLSDYRRRIAYVPQPILLFSVTVRENLLLGNPDATPSRLRTAIEMTGFDQVLRRLPDGLETELGERGESLSGGEARRLMLARAAIRDADILLLDEPFAGIDAASRPHIAAAIAAIAEGRTTFVVSHLWPQRLRADLVIEAHQGSLTTHEPTTLGHGT